jgi:heat shock protein HslJ
MNLKKGQVLILDRLNVRKIEIPLIFAQYLDTAERKDMQRILLILLAGLIGAGCAAGSSSIQHTRSTDPRTILDKTWQWESTITPAEKITVPAPERYTIFLQADGRAQMRFDCNRGSGGFKISPGQLSFGPLLSTRMACPPDSLDSAFMRDLQRVVSFFVDNGTLYLELPYDSGTMKFCPEGAP